MVVSWISAGVSSFISAYIKRDIIDEYIYIHIDDQHEDSLRFIKDCEKVLGKEIQVLQSTYKDVGSVVTQFRFINSAYGAKCTQILKKRVRKEWEYGKKNLTYIWGFDLNERHRVERLNESMPEFENIYPLVDNQLTKQDAHAMLRRLKIKRPVMYDLGYQNNNCIGCVKGGMGYWNKIRKDFPEVFKARAEQERLIGHSCLKECFLDELEPNRGNIDNEISEECGIYCMMNL